VTPADAAYAWLRAAAAGAAAAGVRDVCICPGSRSAPLALAFARQPAFRTWMHLDERSAGFFALGLGKAGGAPAAVICTSGTAAANLAPAVVEAYHAGVPLLVLTADRPPEVRGWGAAQTIDQVRLYGHQVKWFVDAEVRRGGAEALARRAVAVAMAPFPGPVHVNVPLREPLLPGPAQARADPVDRRPAAVSAPVLEVPPLPDVERGLIVAGPLQDPEAAAPITELGTALGWPVAADPLSQVRCGPHHRDVILDSYDSYLRDPEVASSLAPEVVLRFGGPPTSKALGELTRRAGRVIVVDPGWRDPDLTAEVLPCDAAAAARALLRRRTPGDWLRRWQQADAAARRAAGTADLAEFAVFPHLAELLPAGSALVAGNSMPVRDMDGFLPGMAKPLRIFANRGANGVDGVLSTALGIAAHGGPAALVLGDVSFYHDMNGLLCARRYAPPLLVVLVHNDGGGIFSYLPQAALDPAEYEPLFGTPHGLDFQHAAALYGLPHRRVVTPAAFRAAVAEWLAEGGTRIVEVPSDRARSAAQHRAVWAAAAAAVRACS
jgi:2-succinyl-5-enolpyruvyl-6-hydroxy-3-cyclohexene-1-carboxylate synthase